MPTNPLDISALRARLTTDSGLPAQGRATVAEMNIDRAIDELEAARAEIVAYRLRIENDAGRIERLREAVDLYGDHQPGCNWHDNNSNEECDCGWVALTHEPPHPAPPTQAEANARDNERLRRETYEVPMNDPDDEVEYARRCR